MSRSALADGIQRLRNKLAQQEHGDDSDEQLLQTFTTRHDDAAFAVLVRRHGPMVLRICRRVLGHDQDAEDAFQATFLVLARKAAGLRNKASLVGFLHGTAFRTALKAKRAAARRRKYEGSHGELTQHRSPAGPADELSWREALALLHEEIARLPEIYRIVFVLFHLEKLSREETAQRLGLKSVTVAKRLAEARKRLGKRLARRGVELTAVLAATALATQQASALPIALMATTIRAALATTAGEKLAGIVSLSVAQLAKGATAGLMLSKAKLAALVLLAVSLLIVATSGSLVSWYGQASGPLAATSADKPQPRTQRNEQRPSVEISGRVVD